MFFHLLIFSFFFQNCNKFFKTYFHVNWSWDVRVSMILSLLLANISILSCFFFFFLVIFSNLLVIPVVREKKRVKLALLIPTGAPTMLVNEQIDLLQFLHLKQLKFCLCNRKQLHICLVWLISSIKWFSIFLISSNRNFV